MRAKGGFQFSPLFDDLAGEKQERFRQGQRNRLCGGQVADEVEFGGLLDRDVGGLRPAQYLVDQLGGAPASATISE
jgi:hypothetical protein